MSPHPDPEERRLAAAVARLPREIPPPNDGWEAIAARIEGGRRAPKPRTLRAVAPADLLGGMLAAAAAILCILTPPRTSVHAPTAPTAMNAVTAESPAVAASTWSPENAPPTSQPPPLPEPTRADEEPYRQALAALDDDFQRARAQLSPSDATQLDDSLRAIDQAIETTRAAVTTHPDDFDLRTDLLEAYRDKVTTETDVIDLTTRT